MHSFLFYLERNLNQTDPSSSSQIEISEQEKQNDQSSATALLLKNKSSESIENNETISYEKEAKETFESKFVESESGGVVETIENNLLKNDSQPPEYIGIFSFYSFFFFSC